jgi:dCTP deaminase
MLRLPRPDRGMILDLRRGKIADVIGDAYKPHRSLKKAASTSRRTSSCLARHMRPSSCPSRRRRGSNPVSWPGSKARVPSLAGLIIHFTAPTIHAGLSGVIVLEMKNLGDLPIALYPQMQIAQLVVETVKGVPDPDLRSQFQGQTSPSGKH